MKEAYIAWFEQEKAANKAMIGMLGSVAPVHRNDEKFFRASRLAHHLAACRENWLDRMIGQGNQQEEWWPTDAKLEGLAERFSRVEEMWSKYLAEVDQAGLVRDFEFPGTNGKRYRWNIEGQIRQLIGHAFYHRGQIALLVDQLGGETVDTDYLYWSYVSNPERWGEVTEPGA